MSTIEAICNELISEATAVKECTKDIEEMLRNPSGAKAADLFDQIRLGKVEHIQKLALALIECFFDAEAKSSKETDEQEGEANDSK